MRYQGLLAATGLAVVLAVGCATTRVSSPRVAAAQGAIRAAEEMGAPGVPRAQLHLKYARDQLAQANTLLENGESEAAELVLMRAEADAELALALAREESSRARAAQARRDVESARRGGKEGSR